MKTRRLKDGVVARCGVCHVNRATHTVHGLDIMEYAGRTACPTCIAKLRNVAKVVRERMAESERAGESEAEYQNRSMYKY